MGARTHRAQDLPGPLLPGPVLGPPSSDGRTAWECGLEEVSPELREQRAQRGRLRKEGR